MRNLTLALVLLTVASLTLAGQTLPRGFQKVTSVEGITEYSMPNGLHVLLFPDQTKPKVTVNITYLVGSRQEGYGETGMAHLLEHLLFLQTKTRPSIKKDITDHGSQWNGTTSWDRTNYFNTVAASDENLKWAIDLEADRMINARIEKAVLDPEMTVVRNEFESGENNPLGILFQRVLEEMYTYHNYGKLPIGTRSDIEHVPYDKLAAFYHKYYQPDDAVLTVAGKFDESKALAYIDAAFSAIPKPTRALEKTYTEEPTQDGEREVTLRRVGDVVGIAAGYHIPAASHPDLPAIDVLSGVLGGGTTGRLYKSLVDGKKAVGANMGSQSGHDPSFAFVSLRLRPDQSVDEARAAMLKIVEGVADDPPTKEEVERAKTRLLKQHELNLTNSELIGLFLSEYAAMGDWRLIFWERDATEKVTEADVLRVAKAYLKPSNRTLGTFVPTPKPDRAEIPKAPEPAELMKGYKGRAAAAAGEAFDPSPANIESRVSRGKLPGGLKVVLLPKQTRGGIVVAEVTLRYGDEKALFGKSMIASTTGALLMRGTKSKSRQQIQDEIDKLKARITVTGGGNSATARIETTEANLAGALRLSAELLREPSFPEAEFEQVKQQRISGIEAGRHEPQALAPQELSRRYGTYPRGDVRYVSTIDEQIEDVKKVTLDEVRQFHKGFYGASNGEIAITGQFNKAETQKLADELFGSWKSPQPYSRVITNFQKAAADDKTIETPDKQNAAIYVGMPLKFADEDPDYPAMLVANYIYGGSGGSHLVKRIRDKEGLSYGVGSGFQAPTKQDRGIFQEYAICNPANAAKAEASLRDELAKTVKEGFTEQEVADAKKSILQERQLGRSQDQSLVQLLGIREYFERTMKFDEGIDAKIAALTAEQVSAAWKKHIDPSLMSYIKAGDFKKAAVTQ